MAIGPRGNHNNLDTNDGTTPVRPVDPHRIVASDPKNGPRAGAGSPASKPPDTYSE